MFTLEPSVHVVGCSGLYFWQLSLGFSCEKMFKDHSFVVLFGGQIEQIENSRVHVSRIFGRIGRDTRDTIFFDVSAETGLNHLSDLQHQYLSD